MIMILDRVTVARKNREREVKIDDLYTSNRQLWMFENGEHNCDKLLKILVNMGNGQMSKSYADLTHRGRKCGVARREDLYVSML